MIIDRQKIVKRVRETHRQGGAKMLAAFFMVALPSQQIVQEHYYRPAAANVTVQKNTELGYRAQRLGKFIVGDFNKSFRVKLTLNEKQYETVGRKYLNEGPGRALRQIRVFMLDKMKGSAAAER